MGQERSSHKLSRLFLEPRGSGTMVYTTGLAVANPHDLANVCHTQAVGGWIISYVLVQNDIGFSKATREI